VSRSRPTKVSRVVAVRSRRRCCLRSFRPDEDRGVEAPAGYSSPSSVPSRSRSR
jgi:hypothetical protein